MEKDETPNIALQNGDVVLLPVAEDRVFILGEVKAPARTTTGPTRRRASTSRWPAEPRTGAASTTPW